MIFAGNEGVTPNQIEAITHFSLDEVLQSIRNLALRSLVERRGPLDVNNYGIHHLTGAFLQNQITNSTIENPEKIRHSAYLNIQYWIDYAQKSKPNEVVRSNADNLHRAVEFGFEFGQNVEAIRLLNKLHSSISPGWSMERSVQTRFGILEINQ